MMGVWGLDWLFAIMSAGPLATGLVFSLKVDRGESTETQTQRLEFQGSVGWVLPGLGLSCICQLAQCWEGWRVMVGARALFDRASCSSGCPDCDLLANQGP